MSGRRSLFTTAPRIVVKIKDKDGNSTLVAYAVGLDFRIQVDVQPVRSLGRLEVMNYEPVAYAPVSGRLIVVRELKNSLNGMPAFLQQLNPETALASATFDLDIYLKVSDLPLTTAAADSKEAYLTISDVRLTSNTGSLSIGALTNQEVNFVGLLLVDKGLAGTNAEAPQGFEPSFS